MKKIICAFIIAFFSFNSCDDFLEESPKGELSSEGYFTSEAQALANVNTLYRTGAPTFDTGNGAYYGTHGMLGGYLTGYFTSEYSGQEEVVGAAQNLSRTADNCNDATEDIWENAYSAINTANYSVKYTSSVEGISEDVANQYIAEAKFFRAYNYFYLIKTFGDVPFYTEPYESSTDDLYLARTESETIYEQIISDLEDAAEVLITTAFYSNSNRITSNVVNTILSRVYLQISGYPLYDDHYADAATAARAIINSGDHSLTTNNDFADNSAYNKLRTTDGLNEVVYAYEYEADIESAGYRPAWAFPNALSANFVITICNNVYGLKNGIEYMYDDDDLRHEANQFFHWEYTLPDDTEPTDLGATCNWYFYDEEAMLSTAKGGKDANIVRYAEVLLVAAEAIARSEGVNSEAIAYLAEVKARASLSGKTASDYTSELSSLSEDQFVEEVLAERLRELPLEFLIWDDCVRTQTFPKFSASNVGGVTFETLIGVINGAGLTIQETDMLWPLPYSELQRNPNLTQNAGY